MKEGLDSDQWDSLIKMLESNDLENINLAAMYIDDIGTMSKYQAVQAIVIVTSYTIPKAQTLSNQSKTFSPQWMEISDLIEKLEKFADDTFKKSKLKPHDLGYRMRNYIQQELKYKR
jgi:hypothetical protein